MAMTHGACGVSAGCVVASKSSTLAARAGADFAHLARPDQRHVACTHVAVLS